MIYIVHQPNSENIHNQMKPKQFKRVFTIRRSNENGMPPQRVQYRSA